MTMVTVPLAQARRHAAGPIMRAAHAPEPGAAVSLSRNGIDYIGRFRALAAAIALLPASTLLRRRTRPPRL